MDFPKLSWPVKMFAKDHIRKIDLPGKAICSLCINSSINYGIAGAKQLTNHLRTQKHIKMLGPYYDAQMLRGVSGMSLENYGAPTAFYGDTPPPLSITTTNSAATPKPTDRVANMEAMVVAFLAEYSLSFTVAEGLIELAQELSNDSSALDRLKFHRTTASYNIVTSSLHHQLEMFSNVF